MSRNSLILAVFVSVLLIGLTTAQTPIDALNNTPGAYWERRECNVTRTAYESIDTLLLSGKFTRPEALNWATGIKNNFPGWYTYLPCCPETVSEAKYSKYYEESNDFIPCFHPTADKCFRSTSVYVSSTFEKNDLAMGHGQQCCYDKLGNLITKGSGAGTPDFVSPKQDFTKHQFVDTGTWARLSLNEYHRTWYPNQGCSTPFRVIVRGQIDWTDTALKVRRGDIVTVSDATGTVVWGAEGSSCGPEGSKQTAESLLGFALAPPKLLGAPTGGLIGMVYTTNVPPGDDFILDVRYISEPFFIGRGRQLTILLNGTLFLGVNDGYPDNNSGYFDAAIRRTR